MTAHESDEMAANATTPVTTAPLLADRLRTAIRTGELVPNQRLIELDICQQFGVSRGAVRTALQELAADGVVEIMRNKGAKVRFVSVVEAIEITEVRMMLEGLAASKAAERVTDAEADDLADIGRQMRTAVTASDFERYSELNAALHSMVRKIARHRTAELIIDRLGGQVVRYQYRLSRRPGRPNVSLVQHEDIIAAIISHDPQRAMRAMQDHLRDVAAELRVADQDPVSTRVG